jgi:hypothetical protein
MRALVADRLFSLACVLSDAYAQGSKEKDVGPVFSSGSRMC